MEIRENVTSHCKRRVNIRIMIQEISIKNFLSFKDKMTFSFVADQSKFREETQVVEVAKGVGLVIFAQVRECY